MKQIVLEIEDSAFESFMGMIDQCMLYAIQTLRANHVFRFGYDYTWVMMAINEGLVDDYDGFRSPQAFLDYLYEIGITCQRAVVQCKNVKM